MRPIFAVLLLSPFFVASSVFAQTPASAPSAPAASSSAPPSVALPAGKKALTGKRLACAQQADSKQLKGQDKKDEIQVCLSEARTDCLKQAIAQKAVGTARKDAIKSCMSGT